MTELDPIAPFVVYLLCFGRPVDGHKHYIGRTTFSRLGARMIEHTTGHGAALTARACEEGTPWRLARFWRVKTPQAEATFARFAERKQACPICRKISVGIPYRPTQNAAPSGAASCTRRAMTETALCQLDLFKPMKKEARSRPAPSSHFSGN